MAGTERIRRVANIVRAQAAGGNEVAVVVSAMAGERTALSISAVKPTPFTTRPNTMWWCRAGSR